MNTNFLFGIFIFCIIAWGASIIAIFVWRWRKLLQIIYLLHKRYPDVYRKYFRTNAKPNWFSAEGAGFLPFSIKKDIDVASDRELKKLMGEQFLILLLFFAAFIPAVVFFIVIEFIV